MTFVRPLPTQWPIGLAFWVVFAWSYAPEFRVIRQARRAMKSAPRASRDRSFYPLVWGQNAVMFFAWFSAFAFPAAAIQSLRLGAYWSGVSLMVAGSLFRRHCFRMLGEHFRGAVTVASAQPVIQRGAYRRLRHPSYLAGIIMMAGMALALGSWATLAIVLTGIPALYAYRIAVEEQALLAGLGEPYAEYMKRTHRLVPGIW